MYEIEALYTLCFETKKRVSIYKIQTVYALLTVDKLCEEAKALKTKIEADCISFKINPVRI